MLFKGQATTEYIILLGVSLVFFVIIIALANNQIQSIGEQQRRDKAINALADIALAATDVHAQGSGARKVINVDFPDGVEEDSIIIEDNVLRLTFEGNNISRNLDFPISGSSLPNGSGFFSLALTSEGTSVTVSSSVFTVSDDVTFFTLCSLNETQTRTLVLGITNDQASSIQVNLSDDFSSDDVNLSFSPTVLNITSGDTENVTVSISLSDNVFGSSTGFLFANSTNYSKQILVAVLARECVSRHTTDLITDGIFIVNDTDWTLSAGAFSTITWYDSNHTGGSENVTTSGRNKDNTNDIKQDVIVSAIPTESTLGWCYFATQMNLTTNNQTLSIYLKPPGSPVPGNLLDSVTFNSTTSGFVCRSKNVGLGNYTTAGTYTFTARSVLSTGNDDLAQVSVSWDNLELDATIRNCATTVS